MMKSICRYILAACLLIICKQAFAANGIGDATLEPVIPVVNPLNPNLPEISTDISVGTTYGEFNVSESGSAQYSIPVSCPNGGGLTPSVSISYNSQNTAYGLAGYGVDLNGFSSITRGEKNLFNNNGNIQGISYTDSDFLYLDGKRLILKSGTYFKEGAEYCLEGAPFTVVIAHGSQNSSWFEVRTTDGKTYRYGESENSKIAVTSASGTSSVASWHISRMEDIYGNYVTYNYSIINLFAYPTSIDYGMNAIKNRSITNTIQFEYEDLENKALPFTINGHTGQIGRRLKTISTSCNGSKFRTYRFTYDSGIDNCNIRYDRLTRIQEENGVGEKYNPTVLTWSGIKSGTLTKESISIPTTTIEAGIEEKDSTFLAADLTGDGVSDIIRISSVRTYSYSDAGTLSKLNKRVYISRSSVSQSGAVSYLTPIYYTIPEEADFNVLSSSFGGASLMDIDGDGYNDLMFMYHNKEGSNNAATFHVIFGCDVVANKTGYPNGASLPLSSSVEAPLIVTFDVDKDGKDEIICLEKKMQDGSYPAFIAEVNNNRLLSHYKFNLSLDESPKKLFCGDFNNDGLTDIIVIHSKGYKIFYNRGGAKTDFKFANSDSFSGSGLSDQWRLASGDIDGDGLTDFVYNMSGETCLWVARNNGDGTFTHTKSDDTGVANHATNKDDNRFALMVYDIDNDGRSDVLICKARYPDRGSPVYKGTNVVTLLSDGNTLRLKNTFTKSRENDANENSIFIGDFDGDGKIELANYGSDLTSSSSYFSKNNINVYKSFNTKADAGNVTQITDGLGNTVKIEYDYTTNPQIYSQDRSSSPDSQVSPYILPLCVVSGVTSSNGVAAEQKISYRYNDFLVHKMGAGALGFSKVVKSNETTGETVTTSVTEWNTARWIPTETRQVTRTGSFETTSVTKVTTADVNGTFFAYESGSTITDIYGNTATTTSHYDTEKGVLLDRTVSNDGTKMFKKVEYSGYLNISGMWLPTSLVMTQKHADDKDPYSSETRYTYDSTGNVISSTAYYGTEMALTTDATYDTYGNRTSSCTTGKGIQPVTHYNVFDPTGRFVKKSYSSPESSSNTFTYDKWGNLLSESDETGLLYPITTTYTYDGWGNRVSTTSPDGIVSTVKTGWGKDDARKYYTFTSTTGRPWVVQWYDATGRETRRVSFGPQNVEVSKTITYNDRGLVAESRSINGLVTLKESFTYDGLGRILSRALNSGKTTTYSYSNHTVTATTSGRSETQVTDAWGNIKRSSDSMGGAVEYKYSSNGNPYEITSNGETTSLTYDDAGNRTSISDPDAGTITYEYAADGTILSQTDANNLTTSYTYDNIGRISTVQRGQYTIKHTYGTTGYNRQRLTEKAMSNNSISYQYDRYGRVTSESRKISGNGTFTFGYSYDSNGNLSSVSYPNGLKVDYEFDDYGFRTAIIADGKPVYKLKKYTGTTVSSSFMDSLNITRSFDKYGFESKRTLKNNRILQAVRPPGGLLTLDMTTTEATETLDNLEMTFDPITGNLISRKRGGGKTETFGYDDLDRLVSVTSGNTRTMEMTYSANGNILSKTGTGNYTYGSHRPHAVTSVENTSGLIPSSTLDTKFDDTGKINYICDNDSRFKMEFTYGPDMQRCKTVLFEQSNIRRTVLYAGAFERVIEDGQTRDFYYLDNDVIILGKDSKFTPYYTFKDHLGSILSVFDDNSEKVFEADYDPWGVQEVKVNTIGLLRGYTGHEMLSEFGIINMNGRLYDPVLGRFFSPDSYVQFPGLTQSHNRYSYCLNNPLKYNDPSGNLALSPLLAMGLFSLGANMMHTAFFGGSIWKGFALGLLSSAATYGIGQLLGPIGGIGKELLRAGAHGLAGGLFNMLGGGNFVSGFAAGSVSSLVGSALSTSSISSSLRVASSGVAGAISAWLTGDGFLKGAIQGIGVALFNHEYHSMTTDVIYMDEQGEYNVFLQEVECVASRYTPSSYIPLDMPILAHARSYINNGNTVAGSLGSSLKKKHSKNSVIGSNGKAYFYHENQRPFYGNQYVKVWKMDKIGKSITRVTTPVNVAIGFMDIYNGLQLDDMTSKSQGINNNYYNTSRAAAAWALAWGGAELFGYAGGLIGSGFGGVGSIPVAIIGGIVGGIVGAITGACLGEEAVDYFYSHYM